VAAQVVAPSPHDPFSYRISHDLVRESIELATPPLRATRLHVRVAEALERLRRDDDRAAARLAHHLWHAGPLVEQARTSAALLRAARVAIRRHAYVAAEQYLDRAIALRRDASDVEGELEAIVVQAAVLGVRHGYVGIPVQVLERVRELA